MSSNSRFRNDGGYSRSSFARSFFESDPRETEVLAEDDGDDDQRVKPSAAVPLPPSRPPRPLARRASSRGLVRNASIGAASPGIAGAAAAAAASMSGGYNDGRGHAGHHSAPTAISSDDRAASWYTDAKNQGYPSADLDDFLHPAVGQYHQEKPPATSSIPESAFGEEEVLEQYRIMAQHDAMLRVKENTGFDPEEYEKRRKLQPPERSNTNKKNLYGGGKRPQPRLPPMKKITPLNISLKLEEPPMPPPRVNNYFLQQSGLRAPELCTGVTVRSSSSGLVSVNKDEHLVRCLGCRNQLRVKLLATLVSCPDCNTVSPASSTRR